MGVDLGVGDGEVGGGGGEEVGGEDVGGVLLSFGRQLKRFREWAGLSRGELGERVGYSAATIASFEQGRRIAPARFIGLADDVLGAHGILRERVEEVERAQYPAFFRSAAKLEARAVELHVYATMAIPGLLQTEEYAEAVFRMRRPLLGEDTVAQRVAARLGRQKIFARAPMSTISFVIEEAVIRRPIGGEQVMRGQLEQLLLCGQRRNVEIQVIPIQRDEHAALGGPFTLIETTDARRIAYVEVHKESRLFTERSSVREFEEQYGILRAQALTPSESLALVERLLGET
ncbi:helix-turn-helix domain-containing protein [Streptomyces endophyticus]|uniref:Helix-turn-helix domain-containing protein n=1 Tax=Streptomyces endophyticus TaxID=714166 RepID=A0ABU6F5Z4_9ACTN|nr:helix-turn-helix transcriptional regulator [Streptomyces endophyticus]MEB8339430.1 helix-turn-helix domain-containing protein [Streptomyces endophyticus]